MMKMKTKLIFDWGFIKTPVWQKPVWNILPFVCLTYKSDSFLETGVNTPALTFHTGWLKWGIWLTIQEGY